MPPVINSMNKLYMKKLIYIVSIFFLCSGGCTTVHDNKARNRPPIAMPNYCNEYMCLQLQPLFKNDDGFIAPDITWSNKTGKKVEINLNYYEYGKINIVIFDKNKSSPCSNVVAFVSLNELQKTAQDYGCLSDVGNGGRVLKINFEPNHLNEIDELKFISLIAHVWIGHSETNTKSNRSSLPVKRR